MSRARRLGRRTTMVDAHHFGTSIKRVLQGCRPRLAACAARATTGAMGGNAHPGWMPGLRPPSALGRCPSRFLAPVFAPCGARPPASPAAPWAPCRLRRHFAHGLVALPHDSVETSLGATSTARETGGRAPLRGFDGRGCAPAARPARGRAYFGWGRNSFAAPPFSLARLGPGARSEAAA